MRARGGSVDPTIRLPEADRLLFAGRRVLVGEFRLAIGHPSFHDTGAIQNDLVAFPRTSVRIRHEGGVPFVADPSIATLYNRGQVYRRDPVAADGDRSEWFAVERAIAASIAAELDPAAAEAGRPFSAPFAPVGPALYLRQRRLVRRLRGGEPVEELEVEEEVISIVGAVVGGARGAESEPAPTARARDLSERARELLATAFREPLSLTELAGRLETSPFHLCRSFRRATGTTLHAHRSQLRLRAALERLDEARADLTGLALDLGYSSHSHFTSAFRRVFGVPPSAARSKLSAGRFV
jgi:AraC-like DNA-binding protein